MISIFTEPFGEDGLANPLPLLCQPLTSSLGRLRIELGIGNEVFLILEEGTML